MFAFCNRKSLPAKSETAPGNVVFTKEELKGMQIFMRNCNMCHPAGDEGKGPSLNAKKNLPDAVIRIQVRKGFGEMPAFKEEQISDTDLEKLVAFVRILRTI